MIPYNQAVHVTGLAGEEYRSLMKPLADRRWQRWVNRRISPADNRRFDRKTIFILPTGAGVGFGLLLLVMLITGINYQNSLIYLLTFILGAVFTAAMHQTHNNLSGVEMTLLKPGEGFAGEAVPFPVRLQSGHEALAIELVTGASPAVVLSVPEGELADGTLLVQSRERGYLLPDRIRIETRFPFGLLKAWSWLRPITPGVVFPKPLLPPQPPEGKVEGESAETLHRTQGQDQVELRPWREGDLSARVDWKRYSRNGDMVVADWQGEQGSPQWLDFDSFPWADPELRLSYLTAMVLERDSAGTPYGLRLPGVVIEPDLGTFHRSRCLGALGTWGRQGPELEANHGS